jgi:hypothetical protein
VFLDVAQVLDLVRRAAVQVGLARLQPGDRAARAGGAWRLRGDLDQAELDFVDRQRFAGLRVEVLQRGGGQPGLRGVAADAAMLAAAADGDDIEGGFDLAQVFVQRAAQVLQARVVERREGKGEGLGLLRTPGAASGFGP